MKGEEPVPGGGTTAAPPAARKGPPPGNLAARDIHGALLILLLALLCGLVLSAALAVWAVTSFTLLDEDYGAVPPPDPAHLGHTDVFVVDAKDRVVRGPVVADYAGRYSRDPRWPLRLAELEAELPGAVEFVRERLGLGDRPAPPFRIRFRDDEEMPSPLFMSVFQELEGGAARPLIVVGVDALVAGRYDLKQTLRHELAHCWHLWSLGAPFYAQPRWIQEGLADWATGPDCDRLRRLYLDECGSPDIDPAAVLVNGMDGRQERRDYGESWLAFLMIEREFGISAVHGLVAGLFSEGSPQVALQRVTGWDYEEFKRRARAWAADLVREETGDWAAYVAAKRGYLAKEHDAAEAAYDTYLREYPSGAFRALALAESADLRLLRGDPDGARARVDAIASAAPVGALARRCLHLRIRIARAEKDWPAVERLCLDFIHDFEWDDNGATRDVRTALPEARRKMLRAKEGGITSEPVPGEADPEFR